MATKLIKSTTKGAKEDKTKVSDGSPSKFNPSSYSSPIPSRRLLSKGKQLQPKDVSKPDAPTISPVLQEKSVKRKRGRPPKNIPKPIQDTKISSPSLLCPTEKEESNNYVDIKRSLISEPDSSVPGEKSLEADCSTLDTSKKHFLASLDIVSPDELAAVQSPKDTRKLRRSFLDLTHPETFQNDSCPQITCSDSLTLDSKLDGSLSADILTSDKNNANSVSVPRKRGRPRKRKLENDQNNSDSKSSFISKESDNGDLSVSLNDSLSTSVTGNRSKRNVQIPVKFRKDLDNGSLNTSQSDSSPIRTSTGKRGRPRKFKASETNDDGKIIDSEKTEGIDEKAVCILMTDFSTSNDNSSGTRRQKTVSDSGTTTTIEPWQQGSKKRKLSNELLKESMESHETASNKKTRTNKQANLDSQDLCSDKTNSEEKNQNNLSARKRGRPKKQLSGNASAKKNIGINCDNDITVEKAAAMWSNWSIVNESETDLNVSTNKQTTKLGHKMRSFISESETDLDDRNLSSPEKTSRVKSKEGELNLSVETEIKKAKKTAVSLSEHIPTVRKRGRPRKITKVRSTRQNENSISSPCLNSSQVNSDAAETESKSPPKKGQKSKRKGRPPRPSDGNFPTQCLRCGVACQTRQEITKHMMYSHQALWTPECPEGSTERRCLITVLKFLKKLTCAKCGNIQRFIQAYMDHILWCGREHETYKCDLCGREGLKLKWKKIHMRDHAAKEKDQLRLSEVKTKEEDDVESGRSQRKSAKKAIQHLKEIKKDLFNEDHKGKKSKAEIDEDSSGSEAKVDESSDDDEDDGKDEVEADLKPPKPRRVRSRKKTDGGGSNNYQHGFNMSTIVPYLMDTFPLAWEEYIKSWKTSSVFPNLFPLKKHWAKCLKGAQLETYLPKCRESVRFSSCNSETKDKSKSSTLKLFESSSEDGFFVGGPVWASAWCPTPPNKGDNQYVSISCHPSMEEQHNPREEYTGPGLIQIWDCGPLTFHSPNPSPTFALGLAHDSGCVYDMCWCPSGCIKETPSQDTSKGEELLSRLGLLAVAFSDGTIHIYSIPDPKDIPKSGNEKKYIVKAHPNFILHSKFSNSDETHGCCMCVDWEPNSHRSKIVAGYGKGVVCIFDLQTESPLLRCQNLKGYTDLFPFRSFIGHADKVTSCQWHPSQPGYFSTGGYDKQFCIWDMNDTKRGVIKETCDASQSVRWVPLWNEPITVQAEVFSLSTCRVWVLSPMDPGGSFKNVALNTSHWSSWDMDFSPWLHTVVCATEVGILTALKLDADYTYLKKKKYGKKYQFIMYEVSAEIEENDLPVDCGKDKQKEKGVSSLEKQKSSKSSVESKMADMSLKSDLRLSTYEEMRNQCVLNFKTNPSLQTLEKVDSDERLYDTSCFHKIPTEDYRKFPITALYSVRFNPNASSCTWLISGGQSGIVRLTNVSGLLSQKARYTLKEAGLV